MNIINCSASEIGQFREKTFDLVLYNTFFDPQSKVRLLRNRLDGKKSPLPDIYFRNLKRCAELVVEGGTIFVYGIPYELPYYAAYLSSLVCDGFRFIFKYWIVLNLDSRPRLQTLQPAHQGLLLFVKSKSKDKTSNGFRLSPQKTRVPHRNCSFCGRNLKDWGGKKHLMNPAGSALSDVWHDMDTQFIHETVLPEEVKSRVLSLADEDATILFARETENRNSQPSVAIPDLGIHLAQGLSATVSEKVQKRKKRRQVNIEWNEVYQEDCVSFMQTLRAQYPQGVFDLVFADPPYNLEKEYQEYEDDKSISEYVLWCNEWLRLMAELLKPGGTLMVLNLPKWSIYHALFLNQLLDFRHWICWDAMADPRGKLLPAHYSLLYYTKPGSKTKFRYNDTTSLGLSDYVEPPDSPDYCLRQSCMRKRKGMGDDRKIVLNDVWFNIHRIKHRRDRDYHPCQLPEKLLDRIIRLTTDPGDKVFDPFAGVGTTALIAQRLGRDFITCDIDSAYVEITKEKLARDRYEGNSLESQTKRALANQNTNSKYTKKDVETTLQKLALQLGRVPTTEDIEFAEPWVLQAVEELYKEGIRQPLKAAKLTLRASEQ